MECNFSMSHLTVGPNTNTKTGSRIPWDETRIYTHQASSTSALRRDESYANLTLTTSMPCGSSGV
jgi:hypothetical protein